MYLSPQTKGYSFLRAYIVAVETGKTFRVIPNIIFFMNCTPLAAACTDAAGGTSLAHFPFEQ